MRWLAARTGTRPQQDGTGTVWDFVAVGYPKTGNTWTRIMLGRYVELLHGLDATPVFDVAEQRRLGGRGYVGPRGHFTHQPLSWSEQRADDLREDEVLAPLAEAPVLLLVRHPLDVMVSAYMHACFKAGDAPWRGSLRDFIDDPVQGLDKFFRYYALWAGALGGGNRVLLWRYEDVLAEPVAQLGRLIGFLGMEQRQELVAAAVEFASFDSLKAAEAAGRDFAYESSGFMAFGGGDRSNPNAFHVRRGVAGGYRQELPAEIVPALEARVRAEMPGIYGYSD